MNSTENPIPELNKRSAPVYSVDEDGNKFRTVFIRKQKAGIEYTLEVKYDTYGNVVMTSIGGASPANQQRLLSTGPLYDETDLLDDSDVAA